MRYYDNAQSNLWVDFTSVFFFINYQRDCVGSWKLEVVAKVSRPVPKMIKGILVTEARFIAI